MKPDRVAERVDGGVNRRVTLAGQCFPYSCGNGNKDKYSSAIYDWHGNVTSATDPTDGIVSYTYSDADEVTGITGSVAKSGSAGSLVSNVQNGPNGPTTYTLGNGLGEYMIYDGLGRNVGRWLCSGGAPGYHCPNGPQLYGTELARSGSRVTGSCDTTIGCRNLGYDEFNRLKSLTATSGNNQSFSWVYDRYGNRWQQNVTGAAVLNPRYSLIKETTATATAVTTRQATRLPTAFLPTAMTPRAI